MGVKIVSTSGGSVEINPPATASNFVATMPARTGNVMMDGPAFSAYQSTAQALTLNVWTKAQLQTEEFDTNGCFDNATNYRFTPTVTGYYQITANFSITATATANYIAIYKNGSLFKQAPDIYANSGGNSVDALIYFNGSTDYVEMYVKTGSSQNTSAFAATTYFQGSMVRGA